MAETIIDSQEQTQAKEQALVLWLNEARLTDISLVGGKNASLGEMIQQLAPQGINVPPGFATTAFAYHRFMQATHLETQLHQVFANLDIEDIKSLRRCGKKVRSLILETPFAPELEKAITQAYQELCQRYGTDADVAVRSSATAEDLPDASFAGQQETYLNISGESAVLEACKKCYASLFTDRAISYRQRKGFDHFSIALSVCVQKMVR
ncbi:MAG TPA: PEP/pyruvate-binding domain-containing protein, partial [Candidatus Caenarcaniphilales bacterium]